MKKRKSLGTRLTSVMLCCVLAVSNMCGTSVKADNVSDRAVTDATPPVITVETAPEGHKHGDGYCEPPIVTVTDKESTSLKITIEAGEEKTDTEYRQNTVQVPLSEDYMYVRIKITATNDAGISSKTEIFITHSLWGRQGFTVPATCTQPEKYVGMITCRYCDALCSYWKTNKGKPLGHTLGQPQEGKTQEGVSYTKRVCETCGFEEITFEDMEGHEHTFETVTEAPECQKEGATYEKCTDCGYVNQDTYKAIPVTGHRMTEYEVVRQPDCKTGEPGIKERRCKLGCGTTSYMEIIPQHTWSERMVKKEATCTQTGESAVKCTVCDTWDEESIVEIPMKEHQWADHDNDCTTPKQCSVCGTEDVTSESGHALSYHADENGHWQECENEGCDHGTDLVSHEFPKDNRLDCTGSVTCNICGYVKSGNETHNLEWVITPTEHYSYCKNEGCTYRSEPEKHAGTSDNDCETPTLCSKCGYAYIAAKSHSPYGIWLWNEEGHYRSCRNCSQIVLIPHSAQQDDNDCTTPVKCSHGACGYVMSPGQLSHDYSGEWLSSEEGHYHQCQNPNCTVKEAAREHDGGIATCKDKALCDVCGNYYGEVNPLNHMGEREVRDYKDSTDSQLGYTGDTYCLDCQEIVEKGEDIPFKPHDHVFDDIWVTDGTHHWKECTKCHARSEDYEEHHFTEWESDDTAHFRKCIVCGHTETVVHIPEKNDSNCETELKCSVCQRVLVEAKTHNYENAPYWAGEKGHYQLCQNENCTVANEEQEHTGGVASCVSPAVCEQCHTVYGEKNPDNHVGEESVLGYRDATLNTPGYTGDIYCLGCSQVKAYGQEIPAGEREHDFVQDYDGYHHWYECSRCGEHQEGSYGEHQYDENGECSVCGYSEPVAQHTHRWDAGVVTTKPTCIHFGVKTYCCSECGESKIEEIPKTGTHSWNSGKITKNATCTHTGVKVYTCTDCGTEMTEEIPVTAHKWGAWVFDDNKVGYGMRKKHRICSVCKKKETQNVGMRREPYIELNASKIIMQKGQKTTAFKVISVGTGDYVKSVKSNKPSVLKVQKFTKRGAITLKAQKTGKTKLVITLASGLKTSINVQVQKKKVKTKKITVKTKKVTLKKGKKLKLAPVLNPITSQEKLTYASANKKIAKVNKKGVISANKAGKTNIIVRSGSKKIVVKVTVRK